MAYVKLDCDILDSSLWVEDLTVRVVFITMLAMADSEGFCRATAPGIARRGNMLLADVRVALEVLQQPDPDSRTPARDGRRIQRMDGGYLVLNYLLYRDKDFGAALRMRRYRERQRIQQLNDSVTRNVTPKDHVLHRNVTQGEGEGEGEEAKEGYTPVSSATPSCSQNSSQVTDTVDRAQKPARPTTRANRYGEGFESLWAERPRRDGADPKDRAHRAWSARLRGGATPEAMLEGLRRYRAWCEARDMPGTRFVMLTATFLGPSDPPHFALPWDPAIEKKPKPETKPWKPGAYS